MNVEIGHDVISNKPVAIDTARHVLIEGSSGVGKSVLLTNLFV